MAACASCQVSIGCSGHSDWNGESGNRHAPSSQGSQPNGHPLEYRSTFIRRVEMLEDVIKGGVPAAQVAQLYGVSAAIVRK